MSLPNGAPPVALTAAQIARVFYGDGCSAGPNSRDAAAGVAMHWPLLSSPLHVLPTVPGEANDRSARFRPIGSIGKRWLQSILWETIPMLLCRRRSVRVHSDGLPLGRAKLWTGFIQMNAQVLRALGQPLLVRASKRVLIEDVCGAPPYRCVNSSA